MPGKGVSLDVHIVHLFTIYGAFQKGIVHGLEGNE